MLQTPTSTTRRSPAVTFEVGVTIKLVTELECPVAACANVGWAVPAWATPGPFPTQSAATTHSANSAIHRPSCPTLNAIDPPRVARAHAQAFGRINALVSKDLSRRARKS